MTVQTNGVMGGSRVKTVRSSLKKMSPEEANDVQSGIFRMTGVRMKVEVKE